MARRRVDPLVGVERLIVDGTNLLHALAAAAGSGERAPEVALIGRLRAVIPPAVAVEIVLDGGPDRGLADRRIASGVTVRYAGRRSADAVIVGLVEGVARARGGRPAILVVSDDHGLRSDVQRLGAEVASSSWLLGRLSRTRLASPAVGRPRPAPPPAGPGQPEEEGDRRPWRPGRGATTKRGNPRRRPRGGPATMRR
jgi:hypothetical protein